MGIQNWSKNIILVDLPPEPKMFDELDVVTKTIREKPSCNVMLDFSGIDIITGPCIARVSILYKLLIKHKGELVLCNVSRKIKDVFTSNRFDRLQLTNDKSAALKALQVPS